MKENFGTQVFMCSRCGKEHQVWDGACVLWGFDRSIRMSQAHVKRFKPQVFRKPGFLQCRDTEGQP